MSSNNSGEIEVEVCEFFQTLTEDVITRTAFGSSYEDGKAIFRLQAQQMVLAAEAFQKVFIPGYRFFPTKRNISCWKLDREIKKSLMKLIDCRKNNSGNIVQENGPKDLLGLMMQASISSPNITIHDIIEECKSFFFAGKQTTSNLLTWTTILLAMHPQWQVQAREEVLRVCGSRDIPTKDDVVKLKTDPAEQVKFRITLELETRIVLKPTRQITRKKGGKRTICNIIKSRAEEKGNEGGDGEQRDPCTSLVELSLQQTTIRLHAHQS
ncbi:Cytochrome P450 [Corchorus capsularis]|uniref:Cytochrome P450 n=1 Tax=Corchorus capsularis TaxID=210143 RepID=A0A1R3HS00_COCAP|nr:Cytochrome P450 [Corchorus capsularis]